MLKNDRLAALEVDYDYEQSALFSADEFEQDEGAISLAEARLRSETARRAFETRGEAKPPEWYEEYLRLKVGGRPWRVAAYIAWASTPKKQRWPETQEKLASDVLGLTSDRQIIKWRKKDPSIMEMVTNLQAVTLLEHRADVFNALIASAVDPDYKSHQDRKLFLEMTGDYIPSARLDAELLRSTGKNQMTEREEQLIAELINPKLGGADGG